MTRSQPSALGGESLTPGPSPNPNGRGENAASLLGLPVLGSYLFSREAVPHIIDCEISNRDLLTAVRALSFVEDRAVRRLRPGDYRNLGSEELGSVYESLLELHPDLDASTRRFELRMAGGNERKTTGSYYTPSSLIQALLDSALDPVLEEAVRPIRPSPPKSPSPSGRGGLDYPGEQDAVWRARASEAMQQIAKDLRQRQTPAEDIMWEALRNRRLDGLKFRRQHAIANTAYVADFLCYEVRLVIEIDGAIHEDQQQEDAIRQENIEAEGYTVIRFSNEQVYQDLQSVLTSILATARGEAPLHEGEGFGVRVKDDPEQRILALKICDPACGSGHFLIAAARRMAKALATVRTYEDEPAPEHLRAALRDVIAHCIYGVDINPMAVELCKVALWIESVEPGKPLTFLEHRILQGNSLLGTTPRLMAEGIPDDAFKPIEGDDKPFAATLRKQNKQERAGQRGLFDRLTADPAADASELAKQVRALDALPDDTLDGIRARERRYADLLDSPERRRQKLLADAWCAAFVWVKRKPSPPQSPSPSGRGGSSSLLPEGEGSGMRVEEPYLPPMTQRIYNLLEQDDAFNGREAVENEVARLAERYQFFHWYVAFPDVFTLDPRTLTLNPSPSGRGTSKRGDLPLRPEGEGGRGDEGHKGFNEQTGWNGGFDVVLGNPPWERIKIQEKEWFAQRAPEIAAAPNAAARHRMIAELAERDPYLLAAFADDKRKAEGESHFVRVSDRYPLCGRGDVNTYTIFAETSRHVINGYGRVGMIVPSGIATDDTTKYFFQDLMASRSLASLYDFENRAGLFPAVDSRMKFSLITMTGNNPHPPVPSPSGRRGESASASPLALRERGFRGEGQNAEFVFFAHSVADLQDDWRRFTLSAEDIARLNPNTGTMATFRSQKDAEITKLIYQHVPVLIQEGSPRPEGEGQGGEGYNPWGIRFATMFHMSNDSDKFRTRDELQDAGFVLQGNHFVKPSSQTLLPQGEGLNRPTAPAASPPRPEGGERRHNTPGDLGGEGPTRYLPLYEAKMMHQFTHRWATYTTTPTPNPSPSGGGADTRRKSPPRPEGGERRHNTPGDLGGEGLTTRGMTLEELQDPSALVMPRYWVDDQEISARIGGTEWLMGFRDIARSTDERTALYTFEPRFGSGNTLILAFSQESANQCSSFIASMNSFIVDFVVRQKVSGTHLTYNFVKQFPVIPPHTYTPALLAFIVPRVLELTYTAWDLQPFARDVGYDGPPFIWNEERRFYLRCELDALYFHLYQISRDDVDYIMETFPIVKRKDIARTKPSSQTLLPQGEGLTSPPRHEGEGDLGGEGNGGEYRTKRVILEMYDQMAALPTMQVPAPKSNPHPPAPSPSGRRGETTAASPPRPEGEGDLGGEGFYLVPDVGQWATWLNPGPASPDVAHPAREE